MADKNLNNNNNLTEIRLYCPLTFVVEPDDDYSDLVEVPSDNFIDYEEKINDRIRRELDFDEDEKIHGLIAYTDNERLAQKVHSVFPSVEARDGDLYGVVTVKSYGELNQEELTALTDEIEGQLADGFGEHFEQQLIKLGNDKAYISFWNSDDYFLKPESEVFPEQEIKMGGI